MAEPPLQYSGIAHLGRAGLGTFRLGEKQLGWRPSGGAGGDVQKPGSDLVSAEWRKGCGNKCMLRLCLKDEVSMLRFAGFPESALANLKAHLSKSFGVTLTEAAVSTDGWSWGEWELDGNHAFRVTAGGKLSMEIPIGDLSQVHNPGKGDVSLELQDDPTAGTEAEVLHEIRFFVPPNPGAEMMAEGLKDELQLRAGLTATGDALVRVADVPVVAPRGKYDFEFLKQAIKMHGKTQTYTIKYRSIARLFLLELPDKMHTALVIGLDQPLRQGQQLHNFLVLRCELHAKVQVSPEENARLPEDLRCEEEQPQYQLLGKLLKHMSGKPVVAPASEFMAAHPQKDSCIRCSNKTQPGFLFPLKKSCIFITKPVIWIRYEDIESIELLSGAAMMRRNSFDLTINLKGNKVFEFVQAEKEVFQAAVAYFRDTAKLPIANLDEVTAALSGRQAGAPPTSSARRSAAVSRDRAAGGSRSRTSTALPGADSDEEEDDEDYDGDDGEDEGDSSDAGDDGAGDEDEPAAKRPKRAAR